MRQETVRKKRDARSASHGQANGRAALKSLVIVGAGNIGSFLVRLVARLPLVGRVTVIDRDSYESKNLASQDILRGDVGKPKAVVQARLLRRSNPRLSVAAIEESVENVPLGCLRADAILSCLDSRQSRLALAQAAWRLGVPLIDGGVHADGLLGRVEVYVPGPSAACSECGLSPEDYAALEQVYACTGDAAPAPTDAPAHLGALVASLQANECAKWLAGETDTVLVSRQVVIDARWHRHFVTSLRRNPECRFDHATFAIERLDFTPAQLSLGRVLALAPVVRAAHGELTLSVDGKTFLSEVRCPGCGDVRTTYFRLSGRLDPAEAVCSACRRRRLPAGFHTVERLSSLLPKSQLGRSLASFGFRRGDVFTLSTRAAAAHFQIGEP
jgi:molybdopterin/thiamine biosynthesis adenylyltransferase